ncbi:EamA family transporter [Nocardioides mesophilus]|uniref:EamA family transporter n=1 Tax=Nocardioides mesophilus TaxID=433659 RepID=A0A7G9RFB4_9ACTN|nr:EamA family transporter [Nocardioides mesophilus]QNN54289.1 EamA family transporter [Nocardioides mesophilus]
MSRRAPDPSSVTTGLVLVSTGALLFIVNAGVSRVALRAGVDPVTLTTVRVTGTAVLLLVVAALLRPDALRPPTGRLGLLIVAHGLIGVAALQWTYFVAIDRLPVGMALLLEYQAPILVAVWARVVQKEHVRSRMWVGLALAMVGLAAATGIGQGLAFDLVGVAAGLGAAVCFAAYFLIGEHGVDRLDPVRVILWSFLVATVAMNLVSPITAFPSGLLTDKVSMLGRLAEHQAPVWALLVWVVVLGTLVPFGVELTALRHLPATTVTMVAMLEPVGVAALGWVWFYETLDAIAVAGGVAVVVGILLAQSARRSPALIEPPHLA